MKLTRLKTSSVMIIVAIAAFELAVIKSFKYGLEDRYVYDALPMVNIVVLVGIAGSRRPQLRAFAVGFMLAGTLSLLAYQKSLRENPWAWLLFFEPLLQFISDHLKDKIPSLYVVILRGILMVVLAVSHTVVGLAGGFLAARTWAVMKHRTTV